MKSLLNKVIIFLRAHYKLKLIFSCLALFFIGFILLKPTTSLAKNNPTASGQHQSDAATNTDTAKQTSHSDADGNDLETEDETLLGEDESLIAEDKALDATAFKSRQGMYISFDGGYAATNYENIFVGTNNWQSGKGNAFFGAALGYQFKRNLALEVGYNYILTSKAISIANTGNSSSITPQIAYGFLKTFAPVSSRVDVFLQGGVAYVYQNISATGDGADGTLGAQKSKREHMVPAFGGGFHFYITKRIYTDLSYRHISSEFVADASSQVPGHIPALNLFSLSIGFYLGS